MIAPRGARPTIDGIELWGLPVVGQQHDPRSMSLRDDANNDSYIGDCIMPGPPAHPGAPKIIVFFFDPVRFTSSIYFTHDELRNAIVLASPDGASHRGSASQSCICRKTK